MELEILDKVRIGNLDQWILVSSKNLWREERSFSIYNITKIDVPVYFIEGKYDYVTPTIIAENYFKKLEAPRKKLFVFERSAHAPNYEEPERFRNILINEVLNK